MVFDLLGINGNTDFDTTRYLVDRFEQATGSAFSKKSGESRKNPAAVTGIAAKASPVFALPLVVCFYYKREYLNPKRAYNS